jgi:hypothetical protein
LCLHLLPLDISLARLLLANLLLLGLLLPLVLELL